MDETLSLIELENAIIEDFRQLEDWFLQYEYLLAISAEMPHMSKEERTEDRKVTACQSGAWLVLTHSNGKVHVQADSEALIIRGILSIVVYLLDGRTPMEIVAYTPRFIEDSNLKQQISIDRFHGIHSVIQAIQNFASQYK